MLSHSSLFENIICAYIYIHNMYIILKYIYIYIYNYQHLPKGGVSGSVKHPSFGQFSNLASTRSAGASGAVSFPSSASLNAPQRSVLPDQAGLSRGAFWISEIPREISHTISEMTDSYGLKEAGFCLTYPFISLVDLFYGVHVGEYYMDPMGLFLRF